MGLSEINPTDQIKNYIDIYISTYIISDVLIIILAFVMNDDFFDELGEVALGSRLKRLSDRVMQDATRTYKYTGYEMQPKWFTLMSLLADKKEVSINQAAQYLGQTQPFISQNSKEMFKADLIVFNADPDDARRKIMKLSKQGKLKFNKMKKLRNSVRTAAESICAETTHNFYTAIKEFEKALERKSLFERTLEEYRG